MDALSGLTLLFSILTTSFTWVARLHLPFFHLVDGSGQAVQYHPEEYWEVRPHPSQASTAGWQQPPLNEHPFFVMKIQSTPGFTVEQSMGITSFSCVRRNYKTFYIIHTILNLSTRFFLQFIFCRILVPLTGHVLVKGPSSWLMVNFCLKNKVLPLLVVSSGGKIDKIGPRGEYLERLLHALSARHA